MIEEGVVVAMCLMACKPYTNGDHSSYVHAQEDSFNDAI
jgi:hypothetical protein